MGDEAENAAAQVTSSQLGVDKTASISAIGTDKFSWGAVLNAEDNADGTVTVNTVGVEDGQTVTAALNVAQYTAEVESNSANSHGCCWFTSTYGRSNIYINRKCK